MAASHPGLGEFKFIGNSNGCLLIHGLTGTPGEMRYLGERLHAAGFSVKGVLLAGHCTTIEELKEKSWHDWYRSVREAYKELRLSCNKVFVSGISLGALLALYLAYEEKDDITAVASLSTSFFYDGWNTRPWHRWMLPFIIYTPLKYFINFTEGEPYSVKDTSVRYDHRGYPAYPAVSLGELYKLIGRVKRVLSEIKAPTLIVHSREDDSNSLRNAHFLYNRLGSPVKEQLVLENSYHVVTVDYQKDRVADEVMRFFHRFAESTLPS